ncbi:hypothetical protein FQN50_002428 [Emmonsiellopsis sp. PD_5]|nr:hypothetical protein FQN50_002428 [Emmonsiellopsis sp. PD_5]
MGLPSESPNRYVPGPASAVMQDLDTVEDGFLSVGADGVLRSFAKDATVIDYRQLDPDQVKSFAATQLAAWEASGMAMPSNVLNLADSSSTSGVDGRLVTALDQLLDPVDKPAGVSAVKSREVLELLETPKKRQNCFFSAKSTSMAEPAQTGWPVSPSRSSSPTPSLREEGEDNMKSLRQSLLRKAERSHSRVPGLRKVPLPALGIIMLIAFINVLVWIAVAVVLRFHPHALDADHISAIDLMTRRLLATGQKAVTVGTFFSLGHSTIVVITSIVVAATAAAVSSKFDQYSRVGGIIGSSVSSAFLILLGIMNAYILYKLIQQMKKVLNLKEGEEDEMWKIEGGGFLFSVLKKMFRIIDRPWKMYPLAGMCLIDTIDGALMLSLYIQPARNFLPPKTASSSSDIPTSVSTLLRDPGSTPTQPSRNPRDPVAFLYYSIVLTALTVIVAIVIGVLQLLTMILNATEATGRFWDGVEMAGEYYDVIGGSICGCFILFGGLSVVVYPYWRTWVDKRKESAVSTGDLLEEGRGGEHLGTGVGSAAGYGAISTLQVGEGSKGNEDGVKGVEYGVDAPRLD